MGAVSESMKRFKSLVCLCGRDGFGRGRRIGQGKGADAPGRPFERMGGGVPVFLVSSVERAF